ncbi:hypothetical protein AGDE_05298 [Angomonas deanei]|nr:hypothetical protein AGDE_09881 [Angomonas deanei]EPY38631.1 hypothetical protein AGDE_05298 [Angomonas deanei]|eukprot:EPY29730.1 hypothetical protein AGDE_09881 [Angomonas deanei]
MQRVIPELYTDVPIPTNSAKGDYSNLRSKVYDRETLQEALYSGARPYPEIVRVDQKALTLDKFL